MITVKTVHIFGETLSRHKLVPETHTVENTPSVPVTEQG